MKLLILLAIIGNLAFADTDATLIGGAPIERKSYPEIIYIKAGNSRCSATVVSDHVIVTAAHCVADGGEIGPVGFVLSQVAYKAKCKQAPLYRDQKEDHDLALCKVDQKLMIKPAYISKEGPKVGEEVQLSGYGCIASPGNGGNDGILRMGKAKVTQLPKGTDHWFYTKGSVALCYGDSGGPSLLVDDKKHLLIGVNSRGNIKDLSLFTALYTKESLKFIKDFAKSERVEICGITKKKC